MLLILFCFHQWYRRKIFMHCCSNCGIHGSFGHSRRQQLTQQFICLQTHHYQQGWNSLSLYNGVVSYRLLKTFQVHHPWFTVVIKFTSIAHNHYHFSTVLLNFTPLGCLLRQENCICYCTFCTWLPSADCAYTANCRILFFSCTWALSASYRPSVGATGSLSECLECGQSIWMLAYSHCLFVWTALAVIALLLSCVPSLFAYFPLSCWLVPIIQEQKQQSVTLCL